MSGTKLYCVIGQPLGHSLSPLIHNQAFAETGTEGVYLAFPQTEEHLAAFFEAMRILPISGCNITLPFKVRSMDYVDRVSERARRVGAINTVYWQDGALVGENTDVTGFMAPLLGRKFRQALVLGAGGVSRAALAALQELGLERICLAVNGSTETQIDGKTISFKAPYRRLPILEAIKEKTGYDLDGKTEDEIRDICKALGMEIDDTMGKGKLIDEIFGEFCEGTFIQPTFITDYPVEMSPLTKMHRSKPGLTERFELMVNGKELANAYSELNDPIDQEERFKEQLRLSEKGDDEAMFIDQDFLKALQYGMPPTSGIGIGIDRLTMLMTGQPFIQEVLFFPQMRPEKTAPKDAPAKYTELGIPEAWVPLIQKAGYNVVESMKEVNPQKLHMDICGINKKYKLGLDNPTVAEVEGWINRLK